MALGKNYVAPHYQRSSTGKRYRVKGFSRKNRKLGPSKGVTKTVRIYKTPQGSFAYSQHQDKNGLFTKMSKRRRP